MAKHTKLNYQSICDCYYDQLERVSDDPEIK